MEQKMHNLIPFPNPVILVQLCAFFCSLQIAQHGAIWNYSDCEIALVMKVWHLCTSDTLKGFVCLFSQKLALIWLGIYWSNIGSFRKQVKLGRNEHLIRWSISDWIHTQMNQHNYGFKDPNLYNCITADLECNKPESSRRLYQHSRATKQNTKNQWLSRRTC